MNWFQPFDGKEQYAGMVNSYLHAGVEYGLMVPGGVLAAAGILLQLAWRRQSGLLTFAAGASLASWLAANIFSTLWIFPHLWWVPAGAAVWILVSAARSREVQWRRVFVVASGGSLAATLSLYVLGLGLQTTLKIEPSARAVRLSQRSEITKGEVVFLPDHSVLGKNWAKEIRRLAVSERFGNLRIHSPMDVFSPAPWIDDDPRPSHILACGAAADEGITLARKFPEARLILVHPLGKARSALGLQNVTVMLPALDTSGVGRSWRAVAKSGNWLCRSTGGAGQDIRIAWPEAMDQVLSLERERDLE